MASSRFAKLFAVAASAAFVCSMVGVPAYALTDTNLDEGTTGTSTGVSATPASADESPSLQSQPSADQAESMPDNPTKDLPQTVSEEIPDDATVVSEELVVTDAGEVMDLETGDTVTDPQIVGTVDKPADPLAKTDGESFIPVGVAEVKDAMGDTATAPEPDDATDVADTEDAEDDGDVAESQQNAADEGATGVVVRPASLQNNSYGAYWGMYNGTPAFFEADGTLFVQQAKGVIDVSEWQGQIDWQKAKNDGVEGAIIRISYGWGNGFDKQALRNISECKRLGIPFGIYSYSYAYDSTTAAYEGDDMVSLLRQAGVQPGDLSYPVFYDLEKWTWNGHTPPTSPSVYDGIVNAWYAQLQAAGYTNLSVYSYTNYLNTALNSSNIRGKTRWVASYGARTNFPYSTNDRGWQYTSGGSIDGIEGRVDLNAFGNKEYSNVTYPGVGYVVLGDMGEEWRRIGGSDSVIGDPVAPEVCNWTPGKVNCYQNFENGAISWTPQTGAHYTSGDIRSEWAARNFEHGMLGYPTKDEEQLSNGWWRQSFQHGDIWTQGLSKRFVVLLDLRDSFNQHGGFSRLGAPLGNEESLSGGYWRQRFEHGDVWTRNGAAEKYVVLLSLRDSYRLNGDFARIGGPVADEENMGDGWWRQRFRNGDVWSLDGTDEKYVVLLDLRDSFNQHGGFSRLGAPLGNEESLSGGYWRQRFEHGDVWTRNGAAEKYVVLLNLRNTYYERGGFDVLGGPVEDERNLGWIWEQRCQRGTLQAH